MISCCVIHYTSNHPKTYAGPNVQWWGGIASVHVGFASLGLGGQKSIMAHDVTLSIANPGAGPLYGDKDKAMAPRCLGLHYPAPGIVIITCRWDR